jgi:hypothetical protein
MPLCSMSADGVQARTLAAVPALSDDRKVGHALDFNGQKKNEFVALLGSLPTSATKTAKNNSMANTENGAQGRN